MTTLHGDIPGAHGSHGGHDHHDGGYLDRKGGMGSTIIDWATTIDHKKIGVMYTSSRS
ncbi:MAG: hypothetical protein KF705_03505 [Phycisphaeraceae bacterium]|nr:hypothetical protein [Phycisphaeraceae bacterium]